VRGWILWCRRHARLAVEHGLLRLALSLVLALSRSRSPSRTPARAQTPRLTRSAAGRVPRVSTASRRPPSPPPTATKGATAQPARPRRACARQAPTATGPGWFARSSVSRAQRAPHAQGAPRARRRATPAASARASGRAPVRPVRREPSRTTRGRRAARCDLGGYCPLLTTYYLLLTTDYRLFTTDD
jgi:hypothetical protein